MAKPSRGETKAGLREYATVQLVPSLVVLGIYLVAVRGVVHDMYTNLHFNAHPFADAWWACPIGGTIGYLAFLYFGKMVMERRKAIDVKHYMFTYNGK